MSSSRPVLDAAIDVDQDVSSAVHHRHHHKKHKKKKSSGSTQMVRQPQEKGAATSSAAPPNGWDRDEQDSQEDAPPSEVRAPLLSGPELDGKSHVPYYHPPPPPGETEKPQSNHLWFRCFIIGVFYMFLTIGICAACLSYDFWLALLIAILCVVLMSYTVSIFKCCFHRAPIHHLLEEDTNPEQEFLTTLGQVALLACVFGAVVGLGGGYNLRTLIVAKYRFQGDDVDASKPPAPDLGSAYFKDGAHAFPEKGAKVNVGWGWFPTCVAPIQLIKDQPKVSYWAIANGGCCNTVPISCDFWSLPKGGIVIKYTEFFPQVKKAVTEAVKLNKLDPHPDALYIQWGDPDLKKANLKFLTIVIAASAGGLGILLILWKSLRGSRVLRKDPEDEE